MTKIFLLLVVVFAGIKVPAQTAWELKKDQDGIQVYIGSVPNSNIRAVKVTCILNSSLSTLTALLLDANAHTEWVYSTKKSFLVKQLSVNKMLYYSEISMPWPLSNRDVVIELTISQEAGTNVMHVVSNAVAEYVPVEKNKVRVTLSNATWIVTPVGNNRLSIEYIGQGDPGGEVPAWLANSFSTKGPFETFQKLKDLVVSPVYANAQYAFIKN